MPTGRGMKVFGDNSGISQIAPQNSAKFAAEKEALSLVKHVQITSTYLDQAHRTELKHLTAASINGGSFITLL